MGDPKGHSNSFIEMIGEQLKKDQNMALMNIQPMEKLQGRPKFLKLL